MAPHAAKLKRIELLRKSLRASCNAPATESWTVTGSKFIALLGPRAMERSIDFRELVKAVGAKAYAAFATCTLKSLEENAAPAIVARVVTSEATGTRPLECFEKDAAA